MNIATFAGAAILGAALLAGPALADPAKTAKAAGEGASWLFITARAFAFDGTTLTLTDVDPSVVMYAERPARVAEAMPLATFLASWDHGGEGSFQSDPPDADLTSVVDGKPRAATVELSQPHLDGTTLTYRVRVIEGSLPAAGETVSVFFDNDCITAPHCDAGGG